MRVVRGVVTFAALAVVVLLGGCGGGGGGGGGGGPLPPEATTTIVAAGDIAQCGDGPAAASVAARTAVLVGAGDALVLTLGDNVYQDGTPAEFANCFHPTWGAFKDRIRPGIGNHEYYTAGAEGYFGYFGTQAGPDRRGYYSFDFGGWHFISLNSVIDTSTQSAQYLWLKSDLANSSDALCTIAYWHFPAFSSGTEHGSYAKMTPFFEALHTAGVDLLLSGDEHLYERFAPQKADGTADPARGVRQFVVGTGGAQLYPLGSPIPNSEFRDNATHGVLRLTLGQGSYRWQFVPVGGGPPLDAGSGTCHR
jgi:acid phosphatase type 7